MKHLLLLLLSILVCCLYTSRLTAQDEPYYPTALEGANWILFDSETPHYPYLAFVRAINGDTLISGRVYKKLYQHIIDYVDEQGAPAFAPPYTLLPGRRLIALLRDDVEQRKVYGRLTNTDTGSNTFSSDILIHDFSLRVSDTLRGGNFQKGQGAPVVTETGREWYYDEERYYQQSDAGRYYEGIGSAVYGPTSGGTVFFTACCIYSLKDYCVGKFSDCGLVLSLVTELSQDISIRTYPNPFTNQLNFAPSESQAAEPVHVTLRDITGRLLKDGRLGNGLQWSTNDFAPGVYIATFTSEERRATVKLVKQ